ncbi:MAG: MarR family transcriptional regulator [Rhodospirillaceae bacterium]|nr:MarR family transcriptional regulator [Rhodospirillaceae bacterium]MDE0619526.1 MarR family transcriptional regulator [Rhodospirillaceae bacterium]
MSERLTTQELLSRLRENWPDVCSPESDVVLALIRLHGLVRTQTDRVLNEHDLTPAAFEVLVALRSMPPPRQLTPTELYRVNLISSGGLTKVLKTLSGRNLIELVSNRADGRSKIVKLTAKGRRLVETATRKVSAQDRSLFAGDLSPPQIERLRASLLATLAALEEGGAHGRHIRKADSEDQT